MKTLIAPVFLLATLASACADPLAECGGFQIVSSPQAGDTLVIGDTVHFYAVTGSLCPDRVDRAVDWGTTPPNILGLSNVTDTTATVSALAPGLAAVRIQSRERENTFLAVPFFVRDNPPPP